MTKALLGLVALGLMARGLVAGCSGAARLGGKQDVICFLPMGAMQVPEAQVSLLEGGIYRIEKDEDVMFLNSGFCVVSRSK